MPSRSAPLSYVGRPGRVGNGQGDGPAGVARQDGGVAPLRPRPDAATWLPVVALVILLAVAITVTRRVPESPAGRLHTAAGAVAAALAHGDLASVWQELAPEVRSSQAAVGWERLAYTVEGATWRVLEVNVARGRTTVAFLGIPQRSPLGFRQGAGGEGAVAVDFILQAEPGVAHGWRLVAVRDPERAGAG